MTPTAASTIIVLLTTVVVALFVGWALRKERRAKLESTWPTVLGLVARSEVMSGKTIRPKIIYSYEFNGREYVGNVVQSNMVLYSGANSLQRLCDKFPVGSQPTVYVDRLHPSRSVLIPGGDRTFLYFVLALAGFFLLLSGMSVLILAVNPPT